MPIVHKKGFTLIELLVVIAIVAVLSVVVILTLNPAELLRQARDSNRISDLATLKSAISLYLADVTTPVIGTSTQCYLSTTGANGTSTALCGVFTRTYIATNTTTSLANHRKVDATGWIPVDFTAISSGAPVGNLPVDPTNNATFFYAYTATSTSLTFEINANLESTRYANGATNSPESSDGGNNDNWYEVGTASGLAL